MALWGTLKKGIGGRVAAESDSYVASFFKDAKEDPHWNLPAVDSKLQTFIHDHIEEGRRIVIITSGSTCVPLEENTVTFMDSPGVGRRAAVTAEYFLKRGYAVVFLHRDGTVKPFSRFVSKLIHTNELMDMLEVDPSTDEMTVNWRDDEENKSTEMRQITGDKNNIPNEKQFPSSQIKTRKKKLLELVKNYKECKTRLLMIDFTTVQQYLWLLRLASQRISIVGYRGMMILAAGVLNYYVPQKNQRTHRVQEEDEYAVGFVRVPNLLQKIRKEWCPRAYIVTFKLETDEKLLLESCHSDLEKWGVNLVVGNTLETRRQRVSLVTEYEEVELNAPPTGELDKILAASIIHRHQEFSLQRTVLQQSKQLLLLSAKFSMMKINDVLNEDAYGNKKVPFKEGVTISADRKLGDKSPIYTLDKIFQNHTNSARAHVWKRIQRDDSVTVSEQRGSNLSPTTSENSPPLLTSDPPVTTCISSNSFRFRKEILVALSPAGTPETIRDLWGDFWHGWSEDQIKDIMNRMSKISITEALEVVSSPFTGDYSSATAMVEFLLSKIGAAWTEGEQTRIRQTLQNVLSIGYNRSLVEVPTEDAEYDPSRRVARRMNTLTAEDAEIMREIFERKHSFGSVDENSGDDGEGNDEEDSIDETQEGTSEKSTVRVHKTINSFYEDMVQDGILECLLDFLEQDYTINITGYSMGGMLGQLLMFRLGEQARLRNLDTAKLHLVGFGTPRIGDKKFRERMLNYFMPSQMLNVMHPMDTVHAFPPTSEGFEDVLTKIFLKEDGWGVGRRSVSTFSMLPTTRLIDRFIDRVIMKASGNSSLTTSTVSCDLCESKLHSTDRHQCHFCTQRGDHRGANCPNRKAGCSLCGLKNHATGEHKCKVCQQYGHRGRDCHMQRDVGTAEMISCFRFHNFLYYNANLKKSVEFSADL